MNNTNLEIYVVEIKSFEVFNTFKNTHQAEIMSYWEILSPIKFL